VDGEPCGRHIPLDGAVNFRDLGGYRTVEGRTIRWRSLFRADNLSRLSRPDRAVVRSLGIATVIDLRSRAEVDLERFPVDEIPVCFHHLPLTADLPPFDEFRSGPQWFAGHYLDIARQAGDRIAQAVAIVAQRQSHPVVVHCAAGKDRTGVLVAVLLALLGVPDETIAEDYARSADAMDALLTRLLERLPDQEQVIRTVAATMFSATPANIGALLEGIRAEHGSVEGYAAAHGAGSEVVAALREGLLE
jgi:protein tyrosine/serine phosphatase